jgi:hypothetical protein
MEETREGFIAIGYLDIADPLVRLHLGARIQIAHRSLIRIVRILGSSVRPCDID